MAEGMGRAEEEPVHSEARAGSAETDAPRRTGKEDPTRIALSRPSKQTEHLSGFQRTAAAVRTMVPLLQKMLPLLDGNVASVVANLVAPRLLAPSVNLHPVEDAVERLRVEVAAFRDRGAESERALRRIDEQLETMKDTLQRNAEEQRAGAEEIAKIRSRVMAFSVIGLILLVVSIGLDAAIFLYARGVIR